MDVIDMLFKIFFITNKVFPEPSLPYASFTTFFLCGCNQEWISKLSNELFREPFLDFTYPY